MRKPPIIHATRDVGDSHFLHVEQLDLEFSNGERRTYERLKGSGLGAVIIVPMLDDDTVLLVREYGAGVGRYELGLPKGRLDRDETAEQGAERELKEEIGTDKAEYLREMDDWLAYDLPQHLLGIALHGRYRGQRQKWIALRFTGDDSDINVATPEPEFAQWKWLAIEALPRLIVPFKRDTYDRVISEFRDLAFVA